MRAADLPLHYNAIQILEGNLPERAGKLALLSEDCQWTFRQVSENANRVGQALIRLGTRPGDCIGLLLPDSAEWVASFFAALKIGAVSLGMNTFLKERDYAFILQDARVRTLILHRDYARQFPQLWGNLPTVENLVIVGAGPEEREAWGADFDDWIRNEPVDLDAAHVHRDDFCCLNYSSGTTGQPKGIFHAHKDLPLTAQLFGVDVLGLRESDRTFGSAKLFFTFGLGCNLIFPWYAGAGNVLLKGLPRDPENVLRQIERFRPTIHANAPTGFAAILRVPDFEKRYDLSSLRLCVSAAEALPAPIWHAWKERTGVDIVDGIGSTEVFHIFLSNRPGDIRPGSSGRPMAGYELKILDDDGREAAQGEIGTLWVRGESTALFYLHQYERSRATFVGEWVNTGDKYYVDEDGYYWHAGRVDDMLKVGGIWVSPTEVESALLSHPTVLECAVVGDQDSARLVKPRAYVVLKDGNRPSQGLEKELISHCRNVMAEYKRPRWIQFCSELPKTATGKIQRFKLRADAPEEP